MELNINKEHDIQAFDVAVAAAETALPWEIWEAIEAGTGNGIAALRRYRGFPQSELAQMAGITQPYLSAIESGKKSGSAEALKAIADALHVRLDDLLE